MPPLCAGAADGGGAEGGWDAGADGAAPPAELPAPPPFVHAAADKADKAKAKIAAGRPIDRRSLVMPSVRVALGVGSRG